MFSINQPLFLQKTKPLYQHPKYLFGIGICELQVNWYTVNGLSTKVNDSSDGYHQDGQ